ncbi:MAG: conjugal transfer protein TraF [Elusimicrobiota bacterium]
MNKTIAALCAVILAASMPLSASAEEWNTMGPRAMGMGGAGVALAQGPLAAYWNPGALGRPTENAYGFALPFSIHGALTGQAIAGANDLKNAQNNCPNLIATLGPVAGAAACQATVNSALSELSDPTNGLRIDGSAGGNIKIGKIAVFLNGFVDAGIVPRVYNVHTSQAQLAAGQNTSALIVKGAEITELGAGYGHELPWVPGLFVGGDFKIMRAKVGYASQQIIQSNNNQNDNSGSKLLSDLKNGAASSGNVGIDAGALWDANKAFENVWWAPRVGLTGRNLNNPSFTQAGAAAADGVGGKYHVNPQARMGVSISPFHWWNIAADLDMTRNLTPVDGVASRQLGLGTEINIFNRSWINIPLRFGFQRNVEAATNMFTLGAGVNLLHLMIDFAGEASPQHINTQTQGSSTKIPQEFGASVSISVLFGGSEAKAAKKKKAEDVEPVKEEKPAATEKAAPAKASSDVPPAQAEQIKQNAAKSQTELDQTKPAPAGK